MKHNYKHILLVLLLCAIGVQLNAHSFSAVNSDGVTLYYSYGTGSSVYVTYRGSGFSSYNGEYFGNVVIPETVTYGGETYSVTSIGVDAFDGCTGLTSVVIPSSVTSIGGNAFYGCTGLTSVDIPEGVTSIGDNAFAGCSSLTSMAIPKSVTSIGFHAFGGCSGLTSMTIPENVTSIGDNAFEGCTGLLSVVIPNNVTSIGSRAFYNTKLKSLTIGAGVQSIVDDAFGYSSRTSGARPTKVIWLPNTPPSGCEKVYAYHNYVPNDSYTKLFSNIHKIIYPLLSSMFEVDGIKYVPVSPSERTCDAIDCTYDEYAENIKIGKTITYKNITMTVKNVRDSICTRNPYIKTIEYDCDIIPERAFNNCSSLASVTIGNGATAIGKYAFEGCSGLTEVNIPNSVTSIGESAFSGCSGLTSVTIPNSVTGIGYSAFRYCI